MGCNSMLRSVVMMNRRKKKKNNETGAKKLIWPAKGPGCSLSGITMPICKPESKLLYFHDKSQPCGVSCFSVGDRVSSAKSTPLKLVFVFSTKSRTCETSFP